MVRKEWVARQVIDKLYIEGRGYVDEYTLKKVNFFVGANNSGKSRLIREQIIQLLNQNHPRTGSPSMTKSDIVSNFNSAVRESSQYLQGDSTTIYRKDYKIKEEHKSFTLTVDDCKSVFQALIRDLEEISKKLNSSGDNLSLLLINIDDILEKYRGEFIAKAIRINTESKIYFETYRFTIEDFKRLILGNLCGGWNGLFENIQKYSINEKSEIKNNGQGIYIPTLRTLQNFLDSYLSQSESEDVLDGLKRLISIPKQLASGNRKELKEYNTLNQYKLTGKTGRNYFQKVHGHFDNRFKLVDGQLLSNYIYHLRNSDREKMDQLNRFENFLSEMFFNKKSISLVTDIENNELKIFIDKEERLITDVGDGVQAIIMLTYPLFFYDKGIISVEEPELNLHPGWQKELIKLYQGKYDEKFKIKTDNFIFFIATHSNHIIDRSIVIDEEETAVFRVWQNENNTQVEEITSRQDAQTLLNDIGISSTSLWFTPGIIFVEGPSDVNYIEYWLDLYCSDRDNPRLIRGIDYEFIYYGGSLLTHYKIEKEEYGKIVSENIKTTIQNISGQNYFFVIDYDYEDSSFEKAKTEIREKIDEDQYWYDTTVYTIEDYIDSPKANIYRSSSHVLRNLTNDRTVISKSKTLSHEVVEDWKTQEVDFSDFKPSLKINIEKLYNQIISWKS